jgi:hypothetical protein
VHFHHAVGMADGFDALVHGGLRKVVAPQYRGWAMIALSPS